MNKLGKLEKVNLREIWTNEEYDFSVLLDELKKYDKNVKKDYAEYLKTNEVWEKLKK